MNCPHPDKSLSPSIHSAEAGAFVWRVHCADCGALMHSGTTREPEIIAAEWRLESWTRN